MNRSDILDTARHAITVDRAATHGDAEDSLGAIADLWAAYLGRDISAHDVAMLMVLFKVARTQGNPSHADNYVDAAGYAAIAGELATAERHAIHYPPAVEEAWRAMQGKQA